MDEYQNLPIITNVLNEPSISPSLPGLANYPYKNQQFLSSQVISNPYKFIDLFAGIGGFRIALESFNSQCVFSSEIDANAQFTYEKNYGKIPNGDITKIEAKDIPKFDILTAGFPCQAFSIAGYRKGFEDTRGTLFFDIARIIKYHRPKVIFLENVKGLQQHDKGNTLKIILSTLIEDLGYFVKHQILNTKDCTGIPQNRERIFIVGFRDIETLEKFEFPKNKFETKSILDLIEKDKVDDKFYYKENSYFYKELINAKMKFGSVYQWRRKYLRENKSNVCPTLTANMGTGGHNVPIIIDSFGFRKLTPRECARLQGYPDDFILPSELANTKLYQQIGNSVTVPLIKLIFENILKAIK